VLSKESLRRAARERLRKLAPEARAAAGEEIARRVWTLPEMRAARVVLIYAALPGEVPTQAIAEEAWRRGVTLVYPRCLPEERALALHHVRAHHELSRGSYGIREPAPHCPLVRVEEIDVALIPGLAWDRQGGRLGRGAGYYDRLLAHPGWRALRCGVFFAAQEMPHVTTDPWDVRMQVVVTEGEVVRVEKPGVRSQEPE
jgi:5-formyltetrahydrofolate cyclo-ligase